MRPFRPCLAVMALLLFCAVSPRAAVAQLQTGNLYGTVVDEQGQALPGVTVTLTGQGEPQVQVTNAQGQFRFLGLPPGQRQIKTELEGFSTVDYPNIGVNVGRNTSIEVTLSAAVEDVITVTDDAPIVELEQIPTARDPWAILQQTPGVLMDRVNVGGNEAGQQSEFVGQGGQPVRELGLEDFANMLAGNDLLQPKGPETYIYNPGQTGAGRVGISFGNVLGDGPPTAPPAIQDGGMWLLTPPGVLTDRINIGGDEAGQQSQYAHEAVWSVDGVVITDMGALGSSPGYYDFDSFEEMQVTTGGTDPRIQTPGVVLNMVTKRGTNEWRGSGRYTISDEDWSAAANAAPLEGGIQATLGGYILRDRLWLFGTYGTQETYVNQAGVEQEWDWNTLRDVAKTLTVDVNGNDANSPNFDPTKVVQFGYGLDCGIPGYSLFTSTPPQGQNPCPQIRIDVQNFFGTGTFQRLLPDPFASPTIHIGVGQPSTGRVGNIVVDPSDPSGNTVFSTGTTGGTWKTKNFLTTDPNGPTWAPVTTSATGGPQPLFVVNGEPLAEVAEIDPSSIENIEILKGSAATALYGSRAANGVVLVTTKAARKIDDTHIFSSNFYLTGLYSVVNGGFQLVPQGGSQSAVPIPITLPENVDYVAGWVPTTQPYPYDPQAAAQLLEEAGWVDTDGDGVREATSTATYTVLGRSDFTACPNGAWLGGFRLGDPVDLGNGSSFQPLITVPVDCEGDDSDPITWGVDLDVVSNYIWRGFALNDDVPIQPNVWTSAYGFSSGVWFVIAKDQQEEDEDEDLEEVDLNLAYEQTFGSVTPQGGLIRYEYPGFEEDEGGSVVVLNPSYLDGFPTLPVNQSFGSRFRFRSMVRESSLGQVGPGGSITSAEVQGSADPPSVLLVSLGESTGDAFTAYVTGDGPISIDGIAVLEPVAAPPAEVARFEQMMKDAGAAVATVEAYCFQFDGLVPPAGTAYRFAPPEVQKAFEPLARVLDAGQRVKDAGGLVPDTQLDTYFPAISQWAVWTREKGFDMKSFGEAWLGHVKKNVEQAGERMTDELEQAVRERIPGRWRDIEKILAEADRTPTQGQAP